MCSYIEILRIQQYLSLNFNKLGILYFAMANSINGYIYPIFLYRKKLDQYKT